MATSREEVNALIRFSVLDAVRRDSNVALRPKVAALLSQINQVCPPPTSDTDTFLQDLGAELEQLGITKTPFVTAALLDRLKMFSCKQPLILIANVLRDDSRFNSDIWPRAQRMQAFYERIMDLFSGIPCQDAARESMVDLLQGQFFFDPGVGDGEPLYLFRSVDIDCLKLISEYYANQLATLLLHPTFAQQQQGFLILTDWIRYHFHQGAISERLAQFLDDQPALNRDLSRIFKRQNLEFTLPFSLSTILKTPAELPPPYMPAYAQTTLTASEIARYNGAIATLHALIHDPSQCPEALRLRFESCRTLEEVLPIRLALIRESTLKKASQLAKTIPLHPLHHQAITWAEEIMRHCSELSDSEFEAKIDFFNNLLGACRIQFDSDEHGEVPDYFAELYKANSRGEFKSVCWKLQERAASCIDDESIEKLLQAAETVPLLSLLTPCRLAYLVWPAFNDSPKVWSKAYATLVERLQAALVGAPVSIKRSYPHDLRAQLRWLHQCWEHDSVCPIPEEIFMPSNLSGLRILDPIYFLNGLLWITKTRDRGWWVGLPNDMTLTDISTESIYVSHMLSLCAYPQRLRELNKIWESYTEDPSVFPMLFRALKLNKPDHVETLRVFFPKIPPGQVMNCVTAVAAGDAEFLNALDLTRPDQLAAVLGHFFPYHFDRAFFQKYEALFVSLPDPASHIRACVGTLKLRMYRALCLELPCHEVNRHARTLFSSEENKVIAEKIYEVKKIVERITQFAKDFHLTLKAAAMRYAEDVTLDPVIELWKSKDTAHIVLRELLEDVDSFIDLNALLLATETISASEESCEVSSPRQ